MKNKGQQCVFGALIHACCQSQYFSIIEIYLKHIHMHQPNQNPGVWKECECMVQSKTSIGKGALWGSAETSFLYSLMLYHFCHNFQVFSLICKYFEWIFISFYSQLWRTGKYTVNVQDKCPKGCLM